MSSTTIAEPLVPPSAAPPAAATRRSWSGLLQLSLVGIPIKAFPAVRTREVSHFHQLHAGCGQQIRYAKQCPVLVPLVPPPSSRATSTAPASTWSPNPKTSIRCDPRRIGRCAWHPQPVPFTALRPLR